MKEFKLNQLRENYKNSECEMTLAEYIIRESENDPGFFRWLFDDDNMDDYAELNEEQSAEWHELLQSVRDLFVVSTGDCYESPTAEAIYDTLDEAKAYVDEITSGLTYDGVENESNHNHAMVFNLANGYHYFRKEQDEDEFHERYGYYPDDYFEVLDRDAEILGIAAGFYYPTEDNECLYWVEYSIK